MNGTQHINPASTVAAPYLPAYAKIAINTSAGKDSLAMLDEVVREATVQGVLDRVIAVHCDLGERVEWDGTRALAEKQAAIYGIPFYVVSRPQGDLLTQVEERGMWPGPQTRFCTSDHKRGQVETLITQLVTEVCLKQGRQLRKDGTARPKKGDGPVMILNCIGLRAQESDARKAEPVFQAAGHGSSSVRQIDRWLPIHSWTETQVWDLIRAKSLPYHPAYDLGMGRLSCVFCIYAPPAALLIAGHHNRAKLDAYVALETKIGHAFSYNSTTKQPVHLITIQRQLEAGYVPQGKVDTSAWAQCAGGM
jgi:3'-phosphoadenosine 5'-phosphosulfate sulfotransferase (PAPS reductase)/FAD synthetase